ncbi:MAG TPA: diaminobutyrate acetyltransferase [Pararhizobium sp.]|nr:diaminobutyrate acetyltransferase [Pararhizobium sp.]
MPLTEIASGRREEPKDIIIRAPCEEDGSAIWRLVKASGTLDENSMYCNLLQCTHFASTCALAERDGEVVGWVSGYIPPDHPDRLFVWQVCVREDARGKGFGKHLIRAILDRGVCRDVTRLDTTITDDNDASWSLFRKLARSLDAGLSRSEHFEEEAHFDGHHQTEHLVSIGPFDVCEAAIRTAA